jgi:hypothetical protein
MTWPNRMHVFGSGFIRQRFRIPVVTIRNCMQLDRSGTDSSGSLGLDIG